MDDVRESLSAQAGLLNELMTQAIAPDLQEAGLSLARFELLSAVRGSGPGATQAEVASRMGVTAPTLTEAVRSAVEQGWLEQTMGQTDKRVRHLRLTRKASAAVSKVLRAVNKAEAAMVEGLESPALSTAIQTLREANRNLARYANPQRRD